MNDLAEFPSPPRNATWPAAFRQRKWFAIAGALLIAGSAITVYGELGARTTRDLVFSLGLLPGTALVMVWLRCVMRYRLLLCEGELTGAVVDPKTGTFRFLTKTGDEVRGNRRVRAAGERSIVIYDPRDPNVHSIVTRMDFRGGT